MPDRAEPATVDVTRPHVARVYDYLLGGKDHFAADRAVGDQMIASLPAVQVGVRAQRDLLGRVVRYLVGEAGIKQLLDIGSGLPTAENVHEIAQQIDPSIRVVYLDNDHFKSGCAHARIAVPVFPWCRVVVSSSCSVAVTCRYARERGQGR